MFKFEIDSTDNKARAGKIITPHGEVNTPLFLPVGTQAAVKTLDTRDLLELNAEIILANTYHLYLRPGADTVQKLGGLHKFMNWDRPVLTDSGGFQVFSLGFGIEHDVSKLMDENLILGQNIDVDSRGMVVRTKLCKVEDEGPTFQSHIDGSAHFFPPEKSIDIQVKLGADFVVALDECTSPLHKYDYTKTSMERSHRWEARSLKELKRLKSLSQRMFGVIQGGPFEDLRVESAKFVSGNDFFGVGIGGALINQAKMTEILNWIHPHLDPAKPRHLLGIGMVDDIFLAVERGVDIFDCIYPTKIARSALILSRPEPTIQKHYNKKRFFYDLGNISFKEDLLPLGVGCHCYTCTNYTRAYLHHLFRARELSAMRLATIHNIHFMLRLMEEIREAIQEKRFAKLKEEWVK